MKLSNDNLVLVVGGTGAQGQAVVKALVEPSSDAAPSPYTVRILTRDPDHPKVKSKPNSIIRISNWCKGHSATLRRLSARSKAYGAHTLTPTASPSASKRRPTTGSASSSLLPVFPH